MAQYPCQEKLNLDEKEQLLPTTSDESFRMYNLWQYADTLKNVTKFAMRMTVEQLILISFPSVCDEIIDMSNSLWIDIHAGVCMWAVTTPAKVERGSNDQRTFTMDE